ncbi:Xenotropic and polytropic retrovirus receptor 1 [Linnemannia zychae]|nr:Xenotropic and polytropic retrovirus receptor 1 [Linnemannia zychae]
MKFAKRLQEEEVPEWRKAYMNYKQGKKYLKAIETAIKRLQESQDQARLNGILFSINTSSIEQPIRSNSPRYQDADSPTGTTPILIRGHGGLKSYDAIHAPPARSATAPPTVLPPASLTAPSPDSALDATDHMVLDLSDQEQPLVHRPSAATLTNYQKPQRRDTFVTQIGEAAKHQGQSMLRTIQRSLTMGSPHEHRPRPRTIYLDGRPLESVYDQMLEEERTFFRFLDSQLAMVDAFYREKELESVTKLKVLKQQLYVADEWKRRQDIKKAKAEAKSGWYQTEWAKVKDGFGTLMSDSTYAENVTIGPLYRAHSDPSSQTKKPSVGFATGVTSGSGTGPRSRENRATAGREPVGSFPEQSHVLMEDDEESRRQHLNHNVARSRIKAAIYEFYRSMEMLSNYRVLNKTAFTKIMKKFDKTAGWKASKEFLASKLNPSYFVGSTVLDDLIAETEELFIEKFEKGHRRRGMAKLRIPDDRNRPHSMTTARVGLYIGVALPLFILALQSAFSEETESEIPYWSSLLLVYAGLFLPVLFACLFGINMYVWAKARINYKFIFEFDPRDNLDYTQFFELPTFFMAALCIALYLDFVVGVDSPSMFRTYYPLILIGLVVIILFWPLRMFRFGARKWFLQSMWRIVASGYYKVEFRDFFMADEMNSLVYSIEQFEFAICAYIQQWSDLGIKCATSHMWVTPFVTALPAWLRFMQCLRRYHDTFEWFPHLLNAGKYTCSLIQIFVYFSFRHYGGNSLKAAYIMVSIIASIYTFAWDVHMDWGLFQFGKHGGAAFGNPLLRSELVYSRKWVYYLAIVLDFMGRFSWIMRFVPMSVDVMILSFSLALVEVLRRWMWNFFRLENEHLNNCGHFRAIKDIPLPFHIKVEGDSDGDEYEDDNGNENAENISVQDHGSDTKDGRQEGTGVNISISKQKRAAGGHPAASASQTSLFSGGQPRRRPVPKRWASGSSGPPFGLERSSTFVDDAMAQAGFGSTQLEQLASSAFAKFYNRRDFESRIDSGESSHRNIKSRAKTFSLKSNVGSSTGLGINHSGGGIGIGEPSRTNSPADSRSIKPAASLRSSLKSSVHAKRDESEDDEDDDTEDSRR